VALAYRHFARKILREGMSGVNIRKALACPLDATLHPFSHWVEQGIWCTDHLYLRTEHIDRLSIWLVGGSGLTLKQRQRLVDALRAEAVRMALERDG
jgi:hypothetical protein